VKKCESCNVGVIEDVEHFVMQCQKKDIFERFSLCKQETVGCS